MEIIAQMKETTETIMTVSADELEVIDRALCRYINSLRREIDEADIDYDSFLDLKLSRLKETESLHYSIKNWFDTLEKQKNK